METTDLVSPKQVARAIGVSESSLKRWCDQGLIQAVRTMGGHRKMRISDVLRFVREQNHQLVSPEVLDLPPASEKAELGLSRARPLLVDALLAGNEVVARQLVFDLYRAKHSVSVICDSLIAAAFHDIGDRWACQSADPYQERRGCEIGVRILFDLRRIQSEPDKKWAAIGGTIEGDLYSLPSAMVELVLRDSGWNAATLGTSLPFASLIKAIQETKPRLFWLSVSYIREGVDFEAGCAALSKACEKTKAVFLMGGQALTKEIRQKIKCSAFCDSVQHLETIAREIKEKASP